MQNKKIFSILGLLFIIILIQVNSEFLNDRLLGVIAVIFVIILEIFIAFKLKRKNFFLGGVFNSFCVFLTNYIYFVFDDYFTNLTGIVLTIYIILILVLNMKLKLNLEEIVSNIAYFLFVLYIEMPYQSILMLALFFLLLFIKLYFNNKTKEISVYFFGFIFNMIGYFIMISIITIMFWGN